jgi:hypothetical protein
MTIAMFFEAFEDYFALGGAGRGEDLVLTHDLKIALKDNDKIERWQGLFQKQ